MATGQAKTKASELMDAIMALGESKSAPSLDVARLKQRAQTLRSSDLYGASLALGMLAALEFDESEMRKNHELAIKLSPNDYFAYRNYAASLARMNYFDQAWTNAFTAYELAPTSVNAVDYAIVFCVTTGHFGRAAELLDSREKLNPSNPSAYQDITRRAVTYLEEHNISESDIEPLQSICVSVLRDAGVYAKWMEAALLADEDSEWLSYDLILREPVEKVVELNGILCRRLALLDPPLAAEEHVLVMYLTDDTQ